VPGKGHQKWKARLSDRDDELPARARRIACAQDEPDSEDNNESREDLILSPEYMYAEC